MFNPLKERILQRGPCGARGRVSGPGDTAWTQKGEKGKHERGKNLSFDPAQEVPQLGIDPKTLERAREKRRIVTSKAREDTEWTTRSQVPKGETCGTRSFGAARMWAAGPRRTLFWRKLIFRQGSP